MAEAPGALRVERLTRASEPAARRLILAGLEEHWGALAPGLNPDLDDLVGCYLGTRATGPSGCDEPPLGPGRTGARRATGYFAVGWRGRELVACGGYLPVSPERVQLHRMSVARHCRRRGYASGILEALLGAARGAGFREVQLETTATWDDAVGFYQARGFRSLGMRDGDRYFLRRIR